MQACTFIPYRAVTDLAAVKHLAHMSDIILDECDILDEYDEPAEDIWCCLANNVAGKPTSLVHLALPGPGDEGLKVTGTAVMTGDCRECASGCLPSRLPHWGGGSPIGSTGD
jgi:hypothetical protein